MTAPRVVLVDDTADLRQLMRIALRRAGFEVVGEAGDGAAGIELVRAERPDLVVLDLSMPVMDGLEALPHIREELPDAAIVVMSGFGAGEMTDKALARGADGYLQKGAPLTTVVEYLGDALARRGTPPVVPAEDQPPVAVVPTEAPPGPETTELAPVAVLEVGDEEALPVRYANAAARLLLGDTLPPGVPLAQVSDELADLVGRHRVDADTSFGVAIGDLRVQATLRRGSSTLLVYLDRTAADAAALRRAIATTAHEIRGPVTVIGGAAETLESAEAGDLDPEAVAELTDAMIRQARILDGLTTDLLTTAQERHGTLTLQVREIRPADVVVAVLAGRYDAGVEVTDDRLVRADPLRLEQMLSNLLSNARKYGRPPVDVRVRPAGPNVAIDVADHGDGVPEEFRDRLFREFARADTNTVTGTGLGLHVVRTLAEAQGGTTTYAPGPGGGAVFTIELPAV
ncbi:MAG TPA: hybrid sensor histidine kinase/response regulator [Nocardioides sp.]|nr:hybrid sensor histidine kinase/response regulator [Nocardioides sp.]